MIIHRTSDQYLYLRLVHCMTSNSSNGRPRKTPWVKSYAGNKATIILLLKRWSTVTKEITLVIPRTSPQYLYLRLVHCMKSNSSNGRPRKTPWVKCYAGNKATIILLLKRWPTVTKEITLVIPRTSPQYLYLRLVHCMKSNSSNGRPRKAPLVKSNAGNKVTIIPFLQFIRRIVKK